MAPKLRTFSGPANLEQNDYLKAALEIYDFIEFYYGLYLLEQLDKLKELKENKANLK